MYYYPKYVSVAEKKAKAARKLKALKKKTPNIQPVIIQGRSIATTWWGKAWNKNLERYADYSNRIGRGRSYVRHGAVLDLKITPGEIKALVQGSGSSPYRVSIAIQPIQRKKWNRIKETCKGKMDSMKHLMIGKFPKELETVFTREGEGLFPVPKEIKLDCSCPDWAVMCKHVAAVLYGVGARLDQDPGLFFVLRKADIKDLISETVKESKKDLLSKAGKKTSRIIEDNAGLSDLFGIDIEDGSLPEPLPKPEQPTTKKTPVKEAGPKKLQKPLSKKRSPRRIKDMAGIETLLKRRTKKHTPVSEIIKKSDMPPQKVRNILVRLMSHGKVQRVSRGVYRWVR